MNKIKTLDPLVLPHIAETLKALGHPLRLRLLELLAAGERSVSELQAALAVPQAIVSQQLRIMKSGMVVLARRQGTLMLYRLGNPGLLSLLNCLHSCQEYCLHQLPRAAAPAAPKRSRKGDLHV